MKSRKVLIIYKHDIQNIGATEKLFNDLIEGFEDDGRILRYLSKDRAMFKDGSTISKATIDKANSFRSHRLTHLYVDNSIPELKGGKEFIRKALIPIVLPSGNYLNLDAKEDIHNRITFY